MVGPTGPIWLRALLVSCMGLWPSTYFFHNKSTANSSSDGNNTGKFVQNGVITKDSRVAKAARVAQTCLALRWVGYIFFVILGVDGLVHFFGAGESFVGG